MFQFAAFVKQVPGTIKVNVMERRDPVHRFKISPCESRMSLVGAASTRPTPRPLTPPPRHPPLLFSRTPCTPCTPCIPLRPLRPLHPLAARAARAPLPFHLVVFPPFSHEQPLPQPAAAGTWCSVSTRLTSPCRARPSSVCSSGGTWTRAGCFSAWPCLHGGTFLCSTRTTRDSVCMS